MSANLRRPPVPVLRELLRQAERILDKQVDALEQDLTRTERTTRLAVAALAGVVATAGFVGDAIRPPSFTGFAAAVVCFCLSILWTLDFQAAVWRDARRLRHGVDLHVVVREASARSWSEEELLVLMVARMSSLLASNEGAIDAQAKRRVRSSMWMVLGVIVLLTTLAFIAGETMK